MEADGLRCFNRCPIPQRDLFRVELTELIKEGLLLGQPNLSTDHQTRFIITVNPERIPDIKYEIQIDRRWLLGTAIVIMGIMTALLVWFKPFSLK
jgi:hypothetical protein